MANLSASVHGKEDYTSRYLVTERIDGGGTDICIFETYDSTSKRVNTIPLH